MPEPERVHRKGDLVLRRVSAHAGCRRIPSARLEADVGRYARRVRRAHWAAAFQTGGRAERQQSYSRIGHGYRRRNVPKNAWYELSGGAADKRSDFIPRGSSSAETSLSLQ